MQRKIFGPKKDKVAGEKIKLHNKELYSHCSSANFFSGDIIKNNETSVARLGRMRGARRKTGGKRPL